MNKKQISTGFAILAAALYAINIPLSKILIAKVDTTMMAAFLYLGAGFGMLLCDGVRRLAGVEQKAEPLTKKELPFTIAMVVLDIIAPILLMMGIARTNSANASLLNNFEIVATSLIALRVFHEAISRRLWMAIGLVTVASCILSFEGDGSFVLNQGSLLVLAAASCWGLENNCTRMISNKSSTEIVVIKGIFSGGGSLLVALYLGEKLPALPYMLSVLLLGFVAYGLSICFYILAQKELGAAKTSAYYAIAPFLGVTFGTLLLREQPGLAFYAGLALMIVSTILMVKDTTSLQHTHEHTHTHTHEHRHGDLVHTHEHSHTHSHTHVHEGDEEVHEHQHDWNAMEHEHTHGGNAMEHVHPHNENAGEQVTATKEE